jgi:transcriptional regulator with XRE-family HTH domain
MHLGEKIRKVRSLQKVSQEYMGLKLGMSQQEYSKLEAGKMEVDTNKLSLIANVLGVDPLSILEFDDSIVFHNHQQQGGSASVYNYQMQPPVEFLEKYNHVLTEIIHLKEEVVRLNVEIEQLRKSKR